jgi:hypothetical protein
MSDVISFRLNDKNPREAQAREVIKTWAKQGYSLRQILTEALLLLGSNEDNSKRDVTEIVEQLSRLVEQLDNKSGSLVTNQPSQPGLSQAFIASVKTAKKPGMRLD